MGDRGNGERTGPRGVVGALLAVLAILAMGACFTLAPTGPASALPVPLPSASGSSVVMMTFDGIHRDYRLHVPPAASAGEPLPLVLNLHGATQNGLLQEIYSQMDTSADAHGYLVAYPDGTPDEASQPADLGQIGAQDSWDAGQCCDLPVAAHVDDVGFLLAVIRSVAARTPVDLRRVYVTGMSAGGMMAYRMASAAAGHIAAVASVSGQVELPAIHPARAVPTMEFHSVDDPIAYWNGGPGRDTHQPYSVLAGIAKWVEADGCRRSPHVSPTRRGRPGSVTAGESATLVTYGGCRSGATVELWRLTGSGHVWPGSVLNTGPPASWLLEGVGRGTVLLDADQLMWDFFVRHALPGPPHR